MTDDPVVTRTSRPEYRAWKSMKSRCLNNRHPAYANYGGRGIKICDRWMESFDNFFADMGPRPSAEHSLDRFPDNDGGYELSNCRWATLEEQANNRSDNLFVEFQGEKVTASQLAHRFNLSPKLVIDRLNRGLSVDQAIGPLISRNKYEHNGLSMGLHQWARRLGIHYATLRSRVTSGMSFFEAISKPVDHFNLITHEGLTMRLTDWAKKVGMGPMTLKGRLDRGWTLADAIQTPVGNWNR